MFQKLLAVHRKGKQKGQNIALCGYKACDATHTSLVPELRGVRPHQTSCLLELPGKGEANPLSNRCTGRDIHGSYGSGSGGAGDAYKEGGGAGGARRVRSPSPAHNHTEVRITTR